MKRLALLTLALIVLGACTGKLSKEGSFQLYYPSLTEICPGTPISLNPSWIGPTPGDFSIAAIRYQGGAYQTSCFSVNAQTGVFAISDSDNMPTGDYAVDIACSTNGKSQLLSDAIVITMMKPVPDAIKVTPSSLAMTVNDIWEGKELPGAVVASDDEASVKVKRVLIKNVYKDGQLANQYKSFFTMTEANGQFRVNTGNTDFVPGVYQFDFKLTTYKVGAVGEVGLYPKALTLSVESAPYSLTYPDPFRKVQVGTSFTTEAPDCPGMPTGTVFSVKEVVPSGGPFISIKPGSGVLTVQSPSASLAGTTYSVTVTVTNSLGTADFANAFSFKVVSEVKPVTTLRYEDKVIVAGKTFEAEPLECDGDDVEFSLKDLPAALSSLSIDASTGKISSGSQVDIAPGTYTITVLAKNYLSEQTATFSLQVDENPNNFTYVRWGNNLGLEPISEYGNQFRVYQGDEKQIFSVVESDIPAGRPVRYQAIRKTNSGSHGLILKSNNGDLQITPGAVGSTVRVHYFQIWVTVGNDENAVTRVFPLFIHQCGYVNGYKVEYTPFAVRFNPKSGGRGPAPTIVDKNGVPADRPTLDMCPHFHWYNLHGPEEHIEGRVSTDPTFLRCVWDSYYKAAGSLVNYGVNYPMSYWYNYKNGRLPITGAYMDASTLEMVVNPEKFVDDYGYGDGVVDATFYFNTEGKDPTVNDPGRVQIWPMFIWIDPTEGE